MQTFLPYQAGLSDWEVEFLESLHRRLVDEGGRLTERQREKLDETLGDKDL